MICLTFDTDWCPEELVEETLRLCDTVPGKLTFFCTGRYPVLAAQGSRCETGLHPNYRAGEEPEASIAKLAEEVPEAVGLRSHSCTHSHRLLVEVGKRGLRYTSNTSPLYQAGLTPYQHPWGGWELPVYYMDNLDFIRPDYWTGTPPAFGMELLHRAARMRGLYVFDFHPIHLVLNTPNQAWYETNKAHGKDPEALRARAYAGRGVRTYFQELVDTMRQTGSPSFSMSEAVDYYSARMPTGIWQGGG